MTNIPLKVTKQASQTKTVSVGKNLYIQNLREPPNM